MAQRNFKFVTMLGFASTVMASWEVLLVLFKLTLIDGGTPNLFWGMSSKLERVEEAERLNRCRIRG